MKLSLEEEARCKNDQVRLKKGSEVKILDLEEQGVNTIVTQRMV